MATTKQKAWLEHYFKCWNATEAARLAGYKWPNSRGPENITALKTEINARLDAMAMPANEVLARLGKHAAITFDDFVHVIELDDTGRSTVIMSLIKAQERGVLDCIKKLTYHKDGGCTLELHDSQAALMHLDKVHGGKDGAAIAGELNVNFTSNVNDDQL